MIRSMGVGMQDVKPARPQGSGHQPQKISPAEAACQSRLTRKFLMEELIETFAFCGFFQAFPDMIGVTGCQSLADRLYVQLLPVI
jgi:hypothetical protein